MTAPRLEINLDKIYHNAKTLVTRLSAVNISVTGVTKATLGSRDIANVLLKAGVSGLGDSRIENIEMMRQVGVESSMSLLRSPMMSQVERVVIHSDTSFNTELPVIKRLSEVAKSMGRIHGVVLMIELGDLREGVMPQDVLETLKHVKALPNIVLKGIGTNLGCRNGVVTDADNMAVLSTLANTIDTTFGNRLDIVSGGNSGGLSWALSGKDTGRINNLRLGEAILLGVNPLYREPIEGLHTDAIQLVAEVIESKIKPSFPWGQQAQSTFGIPPVSIDQGNIAQTILAVGEQDVDYTGLQVLSEQHIQVLGSSSDHLLLSSIEGCTHIGDEITFNLNYSALLRAMTSPFVEKVMIDPVSFMS